MEYIDPYAVVRNTATLQAHRARHKAARRAARPFLHIAVVGYGLTTVFAVAMILRLSFAWGPLCYVLLAISGASYGMAAIRMRRYLREHPSDTPGVKRAGHLG